MTGFKILSIDYQIVKIYYLCNFLKIFSSIIVVSVSYNLFELAFKKLYTNKFLLINPLSISLRGCFYQLITALAQVNPLPKAANTT